MENYWGTSVQNRTPEEVLGGMANGDQYLSDYVALYVGTVGRAVQEEAPDIPFLTSTPSNGQLSER